MPCWRRPPRPASAGCFTLCSRPGEPATQAGEVWRGGWELLLEYASAREKERESECLCVCEREMEGDCSRCCSHGVIHRDAADVVCCWRASEGSTEPRPKQPLCGHGGVLNTRHTRLGRVWMMTFTSSLPTFIAFGCLAFGCLVVAVVCLRPCLLQHLWVGASPERTSGGAIRRESGLCNEASEWRVF